MPEILVFCEKDEVAFELLSWGNSVKNSLNLTLAAAVLGPGARNKTSEYFAYGADKVYWSEAPLLANFYAETHADAVRQIADGCNADLVLIGSTRRGKELAPRIAQKRGAGCLTDAMNISVKGNELAVSRYTLGGNAVTIEVLTTPKKVISVLPKSFELAAKQPKQGAAAEAVLTLKEPKVKIIDRKSKQGDAVRIEDAQRLVCVGRGVSKKEDLALVEALAAALKAEIGCTRPLAVDLLWFSEEREVGLSGKKCKPRLCVSVGISGQIQHSVGIRDSKVIVAINKDKTAPIFEVADYGAVGDLYEIVPRLTARLKALS